MPHLHPGAQPCCPPQLVRLPAVATGSRRRRLWELPARAHCPVVGVCLPMSLLRRIADKVAGGQVQGDDYELHSGAVHDSGARNVLSEALQRELDQRHAIALRRAAAAKTAESLAQWWHEGQAGDDIAGALWATLTHPRCDETLEERVLHDIHMRQHQIGAVRSVDQQRLQRLQDAHDTLAAEHLQLQRRGTQLGAEQARRIEQLQGELVANRAELIRRDTVIAALHERLAELEAAAPGLKGRFELARDNERLIQRAQGLERSLARAQQDAEDERRRADGAAAALEQLQRHPRDAVVEDAEEPALPLLAERAVLCVGGRPASVPGYRQIVEGHGGRFLHHDGGEQHNATALDSTLASADLVICQTGCISHDAYWRVKDHCKRTGKRCVFVENPSRSGLQRALRAFVPDAVVQP